MDKLNTYTVTIQETLSHSVKVQAKSHDDAIDRVKEPYNQEAITLIADDFVGVKFYINRSLPESR